MTKKEIKAARDRAYYQANKEKKAAYAKAYYKANKERLADYYQANKEKIGAVHKLWRESKKDGMYTIYLLPKEHYVGITLNLYKRLIEHTTRHNRNVEDVKILGKYENKREALDVEKEYHDKGYKGFNTGYANVGKKKGQHIATP